MILPNRIKKAMILGIVFLWFVLLFSFSNNSQNLPLIDTIFGPKEGIDLIILNNQNVDITIHSVREYLPWIKNIHVQDDDTNKNDENVYYFKNTLLHYSILCPINRLSEYFIILQGNQFFTNYTYPYQFYKNNKPIIGFHKFAISMTRKLFNENAFYKHDKDPIVFALQRAIKCRQIVGKCVPSTVLHEINEESKSRKFNKIVKNENVLVVVDSYETTYNIPETYNQVWVVILNKISKNNSARFNFYKDMLIKSNNVIEILLCEKITSKASILITRKVQEKFPKFKPVMIYGAFKLNDISQTIANIFNVSFEVCLE